MGYYIEEIQKHKTSKNVNVLKWPSKLHSVIEY